ncbi:MAG TPA: penicillin-binding transpeptidase domain-containing protein [Marmoricola sp.]
MTRRLLATTASGCAAMVVLSGCSLFSHGPDAKPVAEKAAAELADGTFSASVWTQPKSGKTAYTSIVEAMAPAEPHVHVGDIDSHDDTASATLDWTWTADGVEWRYDTTLALTKSGDAWKATWSPTDVATGLTDGDRLRWSRTQAKRGAIRDADGAAIVKPRPVVRLGIDKTKTPVAQQLDSARSLATLVGIDVKPYVKLVKASGDKAFVPAITFRDDDVPASVEAGYSKIHGAVAIDGTLPLAPTKEFAAPLLGSVGQATAEIVKASKGRVQAGDEVGLSGLQERYDAALAGTPGVTVTRVGSDGTDKTLFTKPAVSGKPLSLTLVPRLQLLAEHVLADTAPASALVAIKPSTGAIVAAASGPGSKGYDTATYGRYAPGSTFKIIDSLALLRSGLTPASTVPCTTSLSVSGKKFTNDSEYPSGKVGRITLTDALANSCNTAFVSQQSRVSGQDLQQAAAALGFGDDHDVGFPAYFGQIPSPGSEVEHAADMIGQGKVLASPMAVATVMASVLAGHAVVPHLVAGHTATADPSKPLTSSEAKTLRTMLRAVVTEPTGTGHGLLDVPGAPVIAKTGTAEFGTTPPLPTHAWMVAGQGDLAVAVFVDKGHTGAGVAGPILEAFLRGAH